MSDEFQLRYEAHQARKRDVLIELMQERHSERMFSDIPVSDDILKSILETQTIAPSSCNRQGVQIEVERDRDRKALLGGLLVGGTGWIHRAPVVLMFWGNPKAYKAGQERHWNSYLDSGILVQQFYLVITALELRCCFTNPQVREFNQAHFQSIFSPFEDGVFCGALAIGHPREFGNSNDSVPGIR